MQSDADHADHGAIREVHRDLGRGHRGTVHRDGRDPGLDRDGEVHGTRRADPDPPDEESARRGAERQAWAGPACCEPAADGAVLKFRAAAGRQAAPGADQPTDGHPHPLQREPPGA
jgi:hypothetical protein